MKMYGPAEGMQLENLSAAPTPASTGRTYFDTTLGYPQVYTGSRWAPFILGQSSALFSNGVSTTSMTIDWSKGLNQYVILGAFTTFKFINPIAGQQHNLVVQQTEAFGGVVSYQYKFDMLDQTTRRLPIQPAYVLPSSAVQVHSWFYSSGILPAYSTIPTSTAQPNAQPPSASFGADISLDGSKLMLGSATSPYQVTYAIADNNQINSFFPKSIVAPTAATAPVACIKISPNKTLLALAETATPFIQLANTTPGIDNSGFFGSPATLPGGTSGFSVDFHPSGNFVACGSNGSPFIQVYPVSTVGWGVKLTNPAILPGGSIYTCAFSPHGEFLAVYGTVTPFLQVYPFNVSTGFGTVCANPSTLPATTAQAFGKSVAWRPQGDWIACAMNTTPYIYFVPFNRGAGTFGTPQTVSVGDIPGGAQMCVQFSPDGNYVVFGSGTSPFLTIFGFNTNGYISGKLNFDGSNPGAQINDMVFHPNGEYLYLSMNTSPFFMTYPMPRVVKNYLKWLD